jgi:HlyD family secretion protein
MSAAPNSTARRSIRRHEIAGMVLVIILALGVGGWAGTVELSGAIIAHGAIVVDSNIKKVQHPTGGVVGELLVRDGDHVKLGDVLVRLDQTVTRANLAIVINGLTELEARKARLESERDALDNVAFPADLLKRAGDPDVAEVLNSERKLFDLRRSARIGQKEQLRSRIAQLNEEIGGLHAQRESKEKQIGIVKGELESVTELWKRNLVQISKLTELQREEARLEGESAQLVAQAAEVGGKVAETQLQIIQIDRDLSSEVAKETREIDGKIGEFVERKVAAEDQLKRVEIRAPQDGIVFQSNVHTVGGVITAGETIMLIVPEADKLAVEAKVNPQDIDQLQIGQNAMLRMSASNQRTTPEITGNITRISADTTTDQRTAQSYYTIRISLPHDQVARLGDIKLLPGMPVEAFVQTGERTLLAYLIKPLRDQVMRTFREQ